MISKQGEQCFTQTYDYFTNVIQVVIWDEIKLLRKSLVDSTGRICVMTFESLSPAVINAKG